MARIIRLLAECLNELHEGFEISELHKRFNEERAISHGSEYAMDYISFLIRSDNEGIFLVIIESFCKYLTWFSQHSTELDLEDQMPIIAVKTSENILKHEAMLIKSALPKLLYPEELVIALIRYYKDGLNIAKEKKRKIIIMSIIDILIEASVILLILYRIIIQIGRATCR